jgi:tRNA wybutosine-synthesizing protein 2
MKKSSSPFQQIIKQLSPLLSADQIALLPSKWEKIGDVLIIKFEKELESFEQEISRAYADVLSCKSVLKDKGGIVGPFREPDVSLIYGDEDTVTIHKENGVRFKLDPGRIMFSSGNMDERKRMADEVISGEVIVDLFAGILYFSLPIAVHSDPMQVYSCEINPTAFSFLQENILLNKVSDRITALFGDNRNVAPNGVADRVIMGYFNDTKQFLSVAFQCLRNHQGIIHFHDTFPNKSIPDVPFELIKHSAETFDRTAQLHNVQHVKSFAPGISHYVLDVVIKEK